MARAPSPDREETAIANALRSEGAAAEPESIPAPSKEQLDGLAALLAVRKRRLLEEIRRVLARTSDERYADLLSGGSDAGDESVADLLSDVTLAEVARDVAEVRDINAAETRIATGHYGLCVDCGAAIGYSRLQAYPTAKRCVHCQSLREKTRASAPHSRL